MTALYCETCQCREGGEPAVDNAVDESCDADGRCACHRREDAEPLVLVAYRPGHYAWLRPEQADADTLTATYGGAHGRVYVGQAAA